MQEGIRQVPIVDTRMMDTLEVIFLEQRQLAHGDLRGVCERVSQAVSQETGLRLVKGRFALDFPIVDDKIVEGHAWCSDGNGSIVDLTASQFNPGLATPIPIGIVVVSAGQDLYKRYLPL